MGRWLRVALALIAPLALTSCFFVPGKFTSDLVIRADRSFTFSYKGEVVAVDLGSQMGKAMSGIGDAAAEAESGEDGNKKEGEEAKPEAKEDAPTPAQTAEEKAKQEAQYREMAVQLAKEAGYRQVEYRGNGIFYVDYAISGTLTHDFVYPYNQDAALIFPWVAIELRGKDMVRVKATGFAKQDSSSMGGAMGGMGGMGGAGEQAESKLDGVFTLTTNAEVVSQNQEEGAETVGADKVISWKVTPLRQDAPMAVLRVKGI